MSPACAHSFSVRLFIQAAITGFLALAPAPAEHGTFRTLAILMAIGAAVAGVVVRSAPAQARTVVIGFEAVAVLVGVLAVMQGYYIPGTIVGVATLISAVGMQTQAVSAYQVPAGYAQPVAPVAPPPPPSALPPAGGYVPVSQPADPWAAPTGVAPMTDPATPSAPEQLPPTPRAMTILPER